VINDGARRSAFGADWSRSNAPGARPRNDERRTPNTERRGPRVALVHDWLTGMRGGEKVLDAIGELFPDAPLYTLVWVRGSVSPRIEARRIVTSIAQALPNPGRFYRHYLPLYPVAVELLNLDDYDLVISSSHCAVKSVVTTGRTVHVCYCHSPMRYAWDQFDAYFGPDQVGPWASRFLRPVMRRLARWDAATAGRVDRFLANSQYVAGRIRRYYNRGSTIVYPPVDTTFYTPDGQAGSPSFLIVSALVPYKRVEVAIHACRKVGVPLRIVGTGPERARLQALAGPDVEFLGWQSDEQIRTLYRTSTATLLPGIEDFGIVPVEAQACGCPVVALDAGGVRETVVDGTTGVLVPEASPEASSDAFAEGLARALRAGFDRGAIRANALRFSRERFIESFKIAVSETIAETNGTDAAQQADRENAAGAARLPEQPQPADRENAAGAARLPEQPQPADRENAAGAARLPEQPQQADRENKQ
jgi:glycosyltransferase involved in cell wall biosynthesis